jgi:hypothetical protein
MHGIFLKALRDNASIIFAGDRDWGLREGLETGFLCPGGLETGFLCEY